MLDTVFSPLSLCCIQCILHTLSTVVYSPLELSSLSPDSSTQSLYWGNCCTSLCVLHCVYFTVCTSLDCTALDCTSLDCTSLDCTSLDWTSLCVLQWTVLHCVYFTGLYFTVLYFTVCTSLDCTSLDWTSLCTWSSRELWKSCPSSPQTRTRCSR